MGFDRPCSLNKEGEVEGVFRTVFHVNFDLAADEDEDSPYPEVRASVSNIDDPEMPAMTPRMWFIGLTLTLASG